MDAIYHKGGRIRPVVAVVKSLASAISIGSGAAAGREGPIIQIGAALGSTLGQIVRMAPAQRNILVAAGAGAGIAATFNTPIGGVMFALELMLPEVSVRTFLPVALATGVATFVGRFFLGVAPAFRVPQLSLIQADTAAAAMLAFYAMLGALAGVAAAALIRGLHFLEDLFEKIPIAICDKVPVCCSWVSLVFVPQREFGHYYIEGVGYSAVQAILSGQLSAATRLHLQMPVDIVHRALAASPGPQTLRALRS